MWNPVYFGLFPVEHDHTFDSLTRELTAARTTRQRSAVPAVKEYKYNKARAEVVGAAASAKECTDRSANAVAQVPVRTTREAFESNRADRIQTIASTVGTSAMNPATDLTGFVPFTSAAADRASFTQFDLSKAVPSATLQHLGAVGSTTRSTSW